MQAMEPLKFGAKIRIQIESDICSGIGRPAPGCFEAARLMALRILEQVARQIFLSRSLFFKILISYGDKCFQEISNFCQLCLAC